MEASGPSTEQRKEITLYTTEPCARCLRAKALLESDAALERVVPQELCEATDGTLHVPQPTCAEDQLSRRRIEIDDTCAVAPYRNAISSVQDVVFKLRLAEADGRTARPEIF